MTPRPPMDSGPSLVASSSVDSVTLAATLAMEAGGGGAASGRCSVAGSTAQAAKVTHDDDAAKVTFRAKTKAADLTGAVRDRTGFRGSK